MGNQIHKLSIEVARKAEIFSKNTHYSSWLRHLLWTLLSEVAGRRAPDIVPILTDKNIFEKSGTNVPARQIYVSDFSDQHPWKKMIWARRHSPTPTVPTGGAFITSTKCPPRSSLQDTMR